MINMPKQINMNKPVKFILSFYLICFLLRVFEYFVLRTDQSFFGEAFIHKLAGIALLLVGLKLLSYKWKDIGMSFDKAPGGILFGAVFGGAVYAAAYGAEFYIQATAGNSPTLDFYVTSYNVLGNRALEGAFLFILICVIGNIINVIMEEGVFRGLFIRAAEKKHSFLFACMFSALLFGLWHIIQPVRNVVDGTQSPAGAFMMSLMLTVTSALFAIQLALLYKVTGSLWAGMTVHFINNASANLLHVVTASGADELQSLRIGIAQSILLIVTIVMYVIYRRRKEKAQKV